MIAVEKVFTFLAAILYFEKVELISCEILLKDAK